MTDRDPERVPAKIEEPAPRDFVRGVETGQKRVLDWLRYRAQARAAGRFSQWAWNLIREDFVSDLMAQLLVTLKRPGFELRKSTGAYVDTTISNLCKRYFLQIARIRRSDPFEPGGADPVEPSGDALAQVAGVLELRTVLAASSPRCRELLAHKYLLGRSLEEIASIVQVRAQTVRRRLHACREALRRRWPDGRPDPGNTNPRNISEVRHSEGAVGRE